MFLKTRVRIHQSFRNCKKPTFFVFVRGRLYQPSPMFVGEERNLPKSGAPKRFPFQLGYALALLTNIRLDREGLPGIKPSSLFRKQVIYDC